MTARSKQSRTGEGSRFSLELPLRTSDAEVSAEFERSRCRDRSLTLSPSDDRRVLVVEDTSDLRKPTVRCIEGLGLTVETVSNGAEALVRVPKPRPRTVPTCRSRWICRCRSWTDVQNTRRLRALGYDGLIVVMTAHTIREDREKCLEAGCDDYLPKPVTGAVIHEFFERYCGGE